MFDLAFSANCSAIGILLLLQLTVVVVVVGVIKQSVEEWYGSAAINNTKRRNGNGFF
jgi:hypothetical protein